ncbi:MAG: SIMPL domain-containing protein [Nitrospirales bacterium]
MTPTMYQRFLLGIVLVALIMVGVDGALADEAQHDPPTLMVSEEGRVQLAPDKAIVNLSVETAGERLEEVQEDNRDRMGRVMVRLQKLGIKKEKIQTSSLSVTPRYPPRPRRQANQSTMPQIPKIIGYTVSHSLAVEVLDLTIVGRVVDSALKAGANRFSHIGWALRDNRPARMKALKSAAEKAREKAQTLARALNVQLIQLLAVTEGGTGPTPQRSTRGRAMMSMAMEDAGSVPVSPGELTVRASVTLMYEIGNP